MKKSNDGEVKTNTHHSQSNQSKSQKKDIGGQVCSDGTVIRAGSGRPTSVLGWPLTSCVFLAVTWSQVPALTTFLVSMSCLLGLWRASKEITDTKVHFTMVSKY